jgi:hypothetical protein
MTAPQRRWDAGVPKKIDNATQAPHDPEPDTSQPVGDKPVDEKKPPIGDKPEAPGSEDRANVSVGGNPWPPHSFSSSQTMASDVVRTQRVPATGERD